MRLVLVLASTLLLLGCGGDPPRHEGPVARDVTAGRPEPSPGQGPAQDVITPEHGGGLGDQYRAAERWKDDTQGPLATLVYVTETGARAQRRPAALIWTSDPQSSHFQRKGSARITVRRLYKEEMAWLLRELSRAGLEALPWSAQPDYDKDIGAERAFHLYERTAEARPGEGGRRRRFVLKDGLGEADKRAFRKLEDRLIQLTMAR
ncbi:MAG: hypothetical protein AB7N76_27740 [Planctomycetota bacterium]